MIDTWESFSAPFIIVSNWKHWYSLDGDPFPFSLFLCKRFQSNKRQNQEEWWWVPQTLHPPTRLQPPSHRQTYSWKTLFFKKKKTKNLLDLESWFTHYVGVWMVRKSVTREERKPDEGRREKESGEKRRWNRM